jgi:colanic acid/amylovoran biosynthesis protein
MLRAVVAELGPDYALAVEPWIGPFEARARLGLYQKLWISRFGPAAGVPGRLLPRRLRNLLGVVTEAQIVGVLDAAGFAYGDQWGPERTERAAAAAQRWHRAGKTTVLLPQAFGPFTSARIKAAAVRLFEAADLTFARDATSFDAVRSLDLASAAAERVALAPDFTNAMPVSGPAEGEATDAAGPAVPHAYIVPNVRMTEQLDAAAAESYVPFLVACANAISERGVESRVLVHEGRDDTALAERVRLEIGSAAKLVREDDPQRLKLLIGRSCLLVGSRYHALVSALCQGVPVVAAGWSHKYAELVRDYDSPGALVSLPAGDGAAQTAVAAALDEPARSQYLSRLKTAGERERARTLEMWQSVRQLLASRSSGVTD